MLDEIRIGTAKKMSRLQKIGGSDRGNEKNCIYYVGYIARMATHIVPEVVKDLATQELEFVTLNVMENR